MADLASGSTAVAYAAPSCGITIFGLAIGMDPVIILAGIFGGIFYHVVSDEALSLLSRITQVVLGGILSGWLAPLAGIALQSAFHSYIGSAPTQVVQCPVATLIGFAAFKYIGPGLMKFGQKKLKEQE